jgi:hypothetical protein
VGEAGLRGDFEEMARRLGGRCRTKAAKRVCAVVAGRNQRERRGRDKGKDAGVMTY